MDSPEICGRITALMRKEIYLEERAKDTALLYKQVRKLCMIICNSPPDQTIKGEIEAMAYAIAHHLFILNADQYEET